MPAKTFDKELPVYAGGKKMHTLTFENREAAVEAISKFMDEYGASGAWGAHNWGWGFAKADGTFEVRVMRNRPCYGEMRAYAGGTRPNDPHPGDLPNPMPLNQKRELFFYNVYSNSIKDHPLIHYYLDPAKSPWRKGLNDSLDVRYNSGKLHGFILHDTAVDPTSLVSLLMNMRCIDNNAYKVYDQLVADGKDASTAFMAQLVLYPTANKKYTKRMYSSYYLGSNTDFDKFIEGNADVTLSNSRTWQEGEDYNRPALDQLFAGTGNLHFTNSIAKVKEALGVAA